ncbi:MAG TPA: hypothetical protein V6C52_01265 [Coleofasciculaceae cyanobacterium]
MAIVMGVTAVVVPQAVAVEAGAVEAEEEAAAGVAEVVAAAKSAEQAGALCPGLFRGTNSRGFCLFGYSAYRPHFLMPE